MSKLNKGPVTLEAEGNEAETVGSEIVERRERMPVAQISDNPITASMQIIAQAAADPSCDVEKMNKLLDMRDRVEKSEAEKLFWKAFPKLQNDLPEVTKEGEIVNDKHGFTIPYAKFEDVIRAIKPIMAKHGFALSFRHKTQDGGAILTTGILSHKGGHCEKDEFLSLPDNSGSKNGIQAIGSTRSYGKRYTLTSLTGIAFGGEDDDGQAAGGSANPQPAAKPESVDGAKLVDKNQIKIIERTAENKGVDIKLVLKHYNIPSLDKLRFCDLNGCLELIKVQ